MTRLHSKLLVHWRRVRALRHLSKKMKHAEHGKFNARLAAISIVNFTHKNDRELS